MRRLGTHVDLIQASMNDIHANIHRSKIITATNAAMETLAGKFSIGMLCRKITVVSSLEGAILPSNLAGISVVRESGSNRLVWKRGEGAVGSDESVYRYFTNVTPKMETDSGLPFLGSGDIEVNSNELSCPELYALGEDLIGETLVLTNSELGDYSYTITAVEGDVITLDRKHPYAEDDAEVRVRPNWTKRIHFVDNSESFVASSSFDIYCWVYPNPLSLDRDMIPLVYPDVLELMTIRRIPETKDRRPVSKKEIEEAIKLAQNAEPNNGLHSAPLTEQGNGFTFSPSIGRTPYKMRGE